MDTEETRRLLHVLWTKAVGTPNYEKPQWMRLERLLEELDSVVKDAVEILTFLDEEGDHNGRCHICYSAPCDRKCRIAKLLTKAKKKPEAAATPTVRRTAWDRINGGG